MLTEKGGTRSISLPFAEKANLTLEASYHLPPGHLLTQHLQNSTEPMGKSVCLGSTQAPSKLVAARDDLLGQHELHIKAIHMAGHISRDFTQGPQEGLFPQQFWTNRKLCVPQEILEIQALRWGSSMSMCHCTHGKSSQKISSS